MEGDGAGLAGLGLGHEQAVAGPVDVGPVEPQRLADPKPLEAQSLGNRPDVCRITGEQPRFLVAGQEPNALLRDPVVRPSFGASNRSTVAA
jgi:hypothetical protein